MATTLATLKQAVKDLTGYDAPAVSATHVLRLCNAAAKRLRVKLAKRNKLLFMSTGTISVTAGTDYYALPTGCQRPLAFWIESNSKRLRLERGNWADRYNASTSGSTALCDTRYTVAGGKVWLDPTPAIAFTLHCDYMPAYTDMTVDASALGLAGLDGEDDWVLGDVCAVLATAQGDKPDGWLLLRDNAEDILLSLAMQDAAGVRTVRDTAGPHHSAQGWRYG